MSEQKGLRFNEGKIRYDLLEPFAMQKLAEVFTMGANKYSDHNWLRGLKWSNITSSLKRHLALYESGEDYDKESGLLHASHIAWNAMALLSHYKYHPDLDDRLQFYTFDKKIGLDIDGILADFNLAIDELCDGKVGDPHDWNNPILCKKFEEVKRDPNFWLSLKPMISPKDIPFEAHCYITSRSIDVSITKQWLDANGFPDAPIYSVGIGESKIDVAKKSGIDYFIDDYTKNFIELNRAGICTFLMDRSYNQKINAGYKRIQNFEDFKQRFL